MGRCNCRRRGGLSVAQHGRVIDPARVEVPIVLSLAVIAHATDVTRAFLSTPTSAVPLSHRLADQEQSNVRWTAVRI